MGHPDRLLGGKALEEHRIAGDLEVGVAVLAGAGVGHLAAGQVGEELVAVTDPEHRDPQLDDRRIDPIGVLGVDRGRPAGEDQPDGPSSPGSPRR